jgi:VCBS repeat-containing protein
MAKKAKTVLVTGAANGIGLAITNYLAEKGDFVYATDINEKALQQLANLDNIETLTMNVTDGESVKKALKTISRKTDGLDGLVNNAGIIEAGPLVELDIEVVKRVLAVNALGMVRVTKAAFPLLFHKKGRIVNIGSEAGRFSPPFNGPYSMSKFAVEAYSDALRRELNVLDMKVILLQVGPMKTAILDKLTCMFDEHIDKQSSLFKKQIDIMNEICAKEHKKASDPIAVAKTVYKALHKKWTKPRYRVKNNFSRELIELLPTRWVDKGMNKILKK